MTHAALPAVCLTFAAMLSVSTGHGEPNPTPHADETTRAAPLVSSLPEASSAEVARCVGDHESARLQRVREQWLLARDAMTRCSADACPLSIRSDCRAWLDELSRSLPTVLIVVERDDEGTDPVELELDGEPLKLPEPLGPIELLPGRHRLRARLGTHAPVDREIVLEKGVKNQVVRFRFAAARAAPVLSQAPAPAPVTLEPRSERPVPALSYWLGGGALVALASSGVLLGSALVSLDSARETCAPGCSKRVRDSIDARLLAADVTGGVGLLLAGLSLYSYLDRPRVVSPAARISPRLSWSKRDVTFALSGQF